MAREFLFRGKTKSGYSTVKGDLLNQDGKTFIVDAAGLEHEIDPESIEEFTGLFDRHGYSIFEGDVLNTNNSTMELKVRVVWNKDEARFDTEYLNGGRHNTLSKKFASNWNLTRS